MRGTAVAERRGSEILYDEIASSRNSSRRENGRALKEVCDQMEKDKVPMAVAEVVRRTGKNGPSYSTVTNKGSQLGEYVKQRINEQKATLKGPNRGEGSIADTVADPVLQARIRDKEMTARLLHRENNALRQLFKNMRPAFDVDGFISGNSSVEQPQIAAPESSVAKVDTGELGGVLLKLLDHLMTRNYKLMSGRLSINMKSVLDAREMKACQAASGLSPEAWLKRFGGPGAAETIDG